MTDAAMGAPATAPSSQPISPRREVWLSMRSNAGAMAGLGVIVLLILSAIFADIVAPHSPIEQFREHFLQPPAWETGGSWEFPLGTDDVGRCVLSRIIHGTRI